MSAGSSAAQAGKVSALTGTLLSQARRALATQDGPICEAGWHGYCPPEACEDVGDTACGITLCGEQRRDHERGCGLCRAEAGR